MSDTSSRAGCAIKPRNLPLPREITVNGVVIDRNAISRETQNHPAAKPTDAWLAAARALVVRELLLAEARRLGVEALSAEDEEGRRETQDEALIRTLVEQQVLTPTATEEECRRFYEQNPRRFQSADIYEVCHILCAADPKDVGARLAARNRAEAAIAAIRRHPDQFPVLAEELSACPSSRNGGNLGQITTGQTVPGVRGGAGAHAAWRDFGPSRRDTIRLPRGEARPPHRRRRRAVRGGP